MGLAAMLVALTAILVFAIGAQSGSLPGSTFEIDGVNPTTASGSNFIVDTAGNLDWAREQRPAA